MGLRRKGRSQSPFEFAGPFKKKKEKLLLSCQYRPESSFEHYLGDLQCVHDNDVKRRNAATSTHREVVNEPLKGINIV